MNINGYNVDEASMKSSTCGMIGKATLDGRKFFVKQFNDKVEPTKKLGEKVYAMNKAIFDEFVGRRKRVNTALREVAGEGGNIVFPLTEAVYNQHWFEITPLIDGVIPDDQYSEVISKLTEDEKILVLKIAIGALSTIHSKKIVHGDLKLTNIMLVKNEYGHYVSKIIDFDGAFFEDDVPLDTLTGTADYYSPEQAIYSNNEDEEFRENWRKNITTKTDIFTMGLVFHEYLTGEKPKPDHYTSSLKKAKDAGKFIYPWQVVLARDKGEEPAQLLIDDKKITDPVLVALIADMISTEPDKRPTALEVLARLNNKSVPIETDTWEEDSISINEEEARNQLVGLRKTSFKKDGKEVHAYEVLIKNGKRIIKSVEELMETGIAMPVAGYEDPRPEDGIEWNMEMLEKYFRSVKPDVKPQMYSTIDIRGNQRVIPANQLVMMGIAKRAGSSTADVDTSRRAEEEDRRRAEEAAARRKAEEAVARRKIEDEKKLKDSLTDKGKEKVEESLSKELWPEDGKGAKINTALLESQKIEFLGKTTMNGVHGYLFKMGGSERFLPSATAKMMKFIINF